ncbi:hypothetical protein OWV82_019961 [Melia azedarach]|uniref:Uncharacterized protein n=1 Tax=Melia azedarach TaxID=155640 RepID=A0ACC1X7Y1_MELAZ|nr:hypothetical protein OWV82_019961 [Melia azedarach]
MAAGLLQYNFFPTDFFYPRSSSTKSVDVEATEKLSKFQQSYYFFPTDFFYPRPVPVQSLKVDNKSMQQGAASPISKPRRETGQSDDVSHG